MVALQEADGWRAELDGLLARLGGLFVRPEPRQQAGRYLEGLLGPVERKNGWQLAEHLGDGRPWRTQRGLSHVPGDEEAGPGPGRRPPGGAPGRAPRPRGGARGGRGRRPGRGRDRLREEGRALGRGGAAVLRRGREG